MVWYNPFNETLDIDRLPDLVWSDECHNVAGENEIEEKKIPQLNVQWNRVRPITHGVVFQCRKETHWWTSWWTRLCLTRRQFDTLRRKPYILGGWAVPSIKRQISIPSRRSLLFIHLFQFDLTVSLLLPLSFSRQLLARLLIDRPGTFLFKWFAILSKLLFFS